MNLLTRLLLPLLLVIPLHAADWPHWRGQSLNSHSSESSGWDSGARLPDSALWEADFGAGASTPLVIGDVLYALGWTSNEDRLFAVDPATGRTLWTQRYACPLYGRHATGDQKMYHGVNATPEYDRGTGYLYTLSTDGDLNC